MSITTKFKQQLKAKAHKLQPIVYIGNKGLTENVKNEVDRGLSDHELIKMKINIGDKKERKKLLLDICAGLNAELVQMVGGVGVIYRKNLD